MQRHITTGKATTQAWSQCPQDTPARVHEVNYPSSHGKGGGLPQMRIAGDVVTSVASSSLFLLVALDSPTQPCLLHSVVPEKKITVA